MARFRIVPSESQVWIEGRSSVHPIHSHTDGLEGWLDLRLTAAGGLDLRSVVTADVEFPVARLHSSNPLEQRELRRRIDAKRFPTITGELTALERATDAGRYRVTGDVTFRGVTRSHTDEMTIEGVDGRICLRGESSFDIRDHGMEPPKILVLRVEPVVTVRVEIVAEPAAP